MLDFKNLSKGYISVKEYSLKFSKLARYIPTMFADSRALMHKFVSGVSKDVVECRMTILVK